MLHLPHWLVSFWCYAKFRGFRLYLQIEEDLVRAAIRHWPDRNNKHVGSQTTEMNPRQYLGEMCLNQILLDIDQLVKTHKRQLHAESSNANITVGYSLFPEPVHSLAQWQSSALCTGLHRKTAQMLEGAVSKSFCQGLKNLLGGCLRVALARDITACKRRSRAL